MLININNFNIKIKHNKTDLLLSRSENKPFVNCHLCGSGSTKLEKGNWQERQFIRPVNLLIILYRLTSSIW